MATGYVILPLTGALQPDGIGVGNEYASPAHQVSVSGPTANSPKVTQFCWNFTQGEEQVLWTFPLPGDYLSGGVLRVAWRMVSATSGNVALKRASVCVVDGATDDDARVFVTGGWTILPVPAAAGVVTVSVLSLPMTDAAPSRKTTVMLGSESSGWTADGEVLQVVGASFEYQDGGEEASGLVVVNVSDGGAAALSDPTPATVATGPAAKSVSDALALTASDPAPSVSMTGGMLRAVTDVLPVTAREPVDQNIRDSAPEQVGLSLAESASVSILGGGPVLKTVSDSAALEAAYVGGVLQEVARSDAATVTVADGASVDTDTSGLVVKTASDTVGPALTDAATTTTPGDNIVTDTFTASSTQDLTAHAADTGQAWTERLRTGTKKWRIDAGTDVAFQDGAEANVSLINTVDADPPTNEYDLTVTIKTVTGGDNQPLLLVARMTDTSNMYVAGIYRLEMNPDMRIWKIQGGIVTPLASGNFGIAVNDVVKFEIRNAAKKLYKNDVEVLTTLDNDLTSVGRAGIGGGQVCVAGDDLGAWRIDNLLLDNP